MNCTGFAFLLAVVTCELPPPPVSDAARFCKTARPITWSRADSEETRRQVKAHNAAWVKLCRPKGAQP